MGNYTSRIPEDIEFDTSDDILHRITFFVGKKELLHLCLVNRRFHTIFRPYVLKLYKCLPPRTMGRLILDGESNGMFRKCYRKRDGRLIPGRLVPVPKTAPPAFVKITGFSDIMILTNGVSPEHLQQTFDFLTQIRHFLSGHGLYLEISKATEQNTSDGGVLDNLVRCFFWSIDTSYITSSVENYIDSVSSFPSIKTSTEFAKFFAKPSFLACNFITLHYSETEHYAKIINWLSHPGAEPKFLKLEVCAATETLNCFIEKMVEEFRSATEKRYFCVFLRRCYCPGRQNSIFDKLLSDFHFVNKATDEHLVCAESENDHEEFCIKRYNSEESLVINSNDGIFGIYNQMFKEINDSRRICIIC